MSSPRKMAASDNQVSEKALGMIGYSISMTPEMMEQVDRRARSLGLNRSQYFAALAAGDLAQGGPLTLHPVKKRKKV